MKYKVRFHLGAGSHFKHWQVKTKDSISYYDPEKNYIVMNNCRLHNNPKVAEKVLKNQVRDVCGWVECEGLIVHTYDHNHEFEIKQRIIYDPKITPFWIVENTNEKIDDTSWEVLLTNGKKLFSVN